MLFVAITFNLFIYPLKIVIGGSNGIAVIVNELFGVDTSLFIQLFYIAALLLGIITLGFKKAKDMLLGTILYPVFVYLFSNVSSYIILDYNDKLLMFLMAGILMGVGNGLIFKNGYICGGTDVIKRILSYKLKMSMGKASFIIDGIIVVLGSFIFGVTNVIYAIIILYISSKVTDKIILGISEKKIFYIMTSMPDEVRECISKKLRCGVTELEAIGGYTVNKNHILMCVISTKDYIKLEQSINKIDSDAFFVITDSYHMCNGK
jgi:uncharacterized membrane-anchored protein YitT (DUF2179 family)